jgi:aconitate hydratase
MGVLPVQFANKGEDWQSLGLTGKETVAIEGLTDLSPQTSLIAKVTSEDGSTKDVDLLCRIDTEEELSYYRNGGILHYVLRNLAS